MQKSINSYVPIPSIIKFQHSAIFAAFKGIRYYSWHSHHTLFSPIFSLPSPSNNHISSTWHLSFSQKLFLCSLALHGGMNNTRYGFTHLTPYEQDDAVCALRLAPSTLCCACEVPQHVKPAFYNSPGQHHSPPTTSPFSPGVYSCSCTRLPEHTPENTSKSTFHLGGRLPPCTCAPSKSLSEAGVLAHTPTDRTQRSHCEPSIASDLKSCHSDGCVFCFVLFCLKAFSFKKPSCN